MEPRLLILETSGRPGWVALAEGPELRRLRSLDETRRHARDLAPAAAELLRDEGWKPRDIHAILVGRGPGSYTGLRVGIMSAKAFAYAAGCAVLGIDTFAAIALQAPDHPGAPALIDVLGDAQQDKLYVQRFARSAPESPPVPQSPLRICSAADWLAEREPCRWVTGPGVRVLGCRLLEESPIAPTESWDPKPVSLLQLGLERYRRGERDDVFALEPCYLRPSSAEEKWEKRA